MKILYIGGGFVGACSAAVSADSGHDTVVFDLDEQKIKKLASADSAAIESCLYEDGLADLLIRNKERIQFTADYSRAEQFLDVVDAVYMCLPTPEIDETGESNVSYFVSAAERLAKALTRRNQGRQEKYVVIVNKSTVPIEMVAATEEIMDKAGVKNYGVVSNPEFLVEGKAIQGSMRPDRVVVGAWRERDFVVMRQVYQRFYNSGTVKYIEVNPKEAAAGKLLANYVLFNKLAVCFDVIGRACEAFSAVRFEEVRKILNSDPRIGAWGLYDSLYAGGSCFIKDARSLAHQLQISGQTATLVQETYLSNKRQLELFLSRAEKDAGLNWVQKKVGLLGLSFKQDTNDVRNSPSIDIVRFLLENRVAHITAYDPAAIGYFEKIFPSSDKITYTSDESEAIRAVDVIIIATDWPQFRGLKDLLVNDKADHRPLIMDGRRIWQNSYADLQRAGFNIIAVGSPYLPGVAHS